MTEYNRISAFNIHNTCCACLCYSEEMHAMSYEELNCYQTLVCKVFTELKIYICSICRHLLRKYSRFAEQCQDANYLLTQMLQQDIKKRPAPLTRPYLTKHTECHYVGPQNIDLEVDIKCEELPEEYHDDDDEIPLFMLKNGEEKVKKKKRKRSRGVVSTKELLDSSELNPSLEKNKTDKKKKIIREGFSSRMVQETDEYLVIKLTKDQVLEEMQEKLNSEKYKRALYKCEKCVKGFNFEDVLRSHMEKHTKENGTLQCDICTQYCPSAVSLRGHMKSHTTRYKCKVCGDVRLSRQHLLEHHAISHTDQPAAYTCEHCYFTTNKRTVIQRHVKTHRPGERHACHQCGRLFHNIESLRVHSARHDKSKSLQCEYCSRKFIYPSLLQKHVQSVHVHKDYYCVECDVRFKSPDNLRLHFKKAKKHRDSSSYTHECPQCEEKFVSAASLSVHLTAAHGEPKSYSCDLCRRLYSSRESLKGHVRRVHSERQPTEQSCEICKKTFSRKSVLTVHMRTHTGERPHACALCPAAYAHATALRAHTASAHPAHAHAQQQTQENQL